MPGRSQSSRWDGAPTGVQDLAQRRGDVFGLDPPDANRFWNNAPVSKRGVRRTNPRDLRKVDDVAEYGAEITSVKLERGACFGRCPVYDVTLAADGTAVWNGD